MNEITKKQMAEMRKTVTSEMGRNSWKSRTKGKSKKQIKEMMKKASDKGVEARKNKAKSVVHSFVK